MQRLDLEEGLDLSLGQGGKGEREGRGDGRERRGEVRERRGGIVGDLTMK